MKSIIKLFIASFITIIFYSCGDSRFVLKMHNDIVEDFKLKGTRAYYGKRLEIKLDGYYCTLESKFEKLKSLVPNSLYDSTSCTFHIDYQYIESMRQFVRNKNFKNAKRLDTLSEFDHQRIKRFYDSLWIIKNGAID